MLDMPHKQRLIMNRLLFFFLKRSAIIVDMATFPVDVYVAFVGGVSGVIR